MLASKRVRLKDIEYYVRRLEVHVCNNRHVKMGQLYLNTYCSLKGPFRNVKMAGLYQELRLTTCRFVSFKSPPW